MDANEEDVNEEDTERRATEMGGKRGEGEWGVEERKSCKNW